MPKLGEDAEPLLLVELKKEVKADWSDWDREVKLD